ncbi:hypothetical protein [Nostoc sp. CHAB 5836]|uniref:hypothetical protein n=1 Tax=Nostoc sp. CHAB 5836 TaxID=2780404 RepID=UPI001E3DE928|nr:hypothetical protein [Nostoc sp. CHAB 5836]
MPDKRTGKNKHCQVYRGIRDDGVGIIVKMLKLDYPSPHAFIHFSWSCDRSERHSGQNPCSQYLLWRF